MIGKLLKGRGARGLAEYLLGSHDHNGELRDSVEVIGGTFSGTNAREIAAEFGALHQLRPTLGVHVMHMSLRLPPDERPVSNDEFAAIARHWAEGMGIEGYSVIRHGDDHVHIAASRIRSDGSVVSDNWDWKRSEQLVRQIEERFDLVQVEASHLLEPERAAEHRKAPRMEEIALAEKGQIVAKEVIADLIQSQLGNGKVSASDFARRLENAGVTVIPNLSSTGKLSGFAYELDGQRITASALGRGFTLGNLKKQGLDYEQSRDFEALNRLRHEREDRILARPDDGNRHGSDRRRAEAQGSEPSAARDGRGPLEAPGARRGIDVEAHGRDSHAPSEDERSHGGPGAADNQPAEESSLRRHEGSGAGQDGPPSPGRAHEGAPAAVSGSSAIAAADSPTGRGGGVPRRPGSGGGGGVAGMEGGGAGDLSDAIMLEGEGYAAAAAFLRRWAAAYAKANKKQTAAVYGGGGGSMKGYGYDQRAEAGGWTAESHGRDLQGSGGRSRHIERDSVSHPESRRGQGRRSDGGVAAGPERDPRWTGSNPQASGPDREAYRENLIAAARIRAALAPQHEQRQALQQAVQESRRRLATESGPATRHLQALAGLVHTGQGGDRTLTQVKAQVSALSDVALFEVQPLPPKGTKGLTVEQVRSWTAEQVVKAVGWLKRQNAVGYDIYFRPAPLPDGKHPPFAFVDDVNESQVRQMHADGLPFAVLIQSSPGNFQGWVRLGKEPLPPHEVTKAAQTLAERYGADPASATHRHYGRLSGFTNRKPERRTEKGPPFALLHKPVPGIAPGAADLMKEVRETLRAEEDARLRAELERRNAAAFWGDRDRLDDAAAYFLRARERARTDDESARDFSACLAMFRRGYDLDQVSAAMHQASPDLERRHRNVEDYIRRTVEKAEEIIAQSDPQYR